MTKLTIRRASAPLHWYHFDQNNTGGSFDLDESRKETPKVSNLVQARSEGEAWATMRLHGATNLGSCPCCGDRWVELPDPESPKSILTTLFYTSTRGWTDFQKITNLYFADGRVLEVKLEKDITATLAAVIAFMWPEAAPLELVVKTLQALKVDDDFFAMADERPFDARVSEILGAVVLRLQLPL